MALMWLQLEYIVMPVTCRFSKDILKTIKWHIAIFDEAHKLKNHKALIYEACSELKTRLRYGLTGTAMQVPGP